MKLQVTRENLSRALNAVARIANSRGTLPVLANVLIKTNKSRLGLSATNLDIAITDYIGAKVSDEGSITVPARLMQDYISSLPDGIIELELIDTKLHIKTDKYQSVVNGIVADDFPVMPAISKGKSIKIDGPIFKKGLSQVVFAASSDETRPVLTGVLLHSEGRDLIMAATDSYRLAEKKIGTSQESLRLLLPALSMQELLRAIDSEESEVSVTYDEQQAMFKVGDIEFVTRLLDGNYPDYRRLIPEKFETSAVLKKSDMTNVTKVSSLFARESAGSITIDVNEESQELSIRSVASQLGENTARASAKVTGSGSITVNSRYMLDALSATTGEDISFNFNGKLEPTLLKNEADVDYKHVIMPIKS